jgi:hypothetical protein
MPVRALLLGAICALLSASPVRAHHSRQLRHVKWTTMEGRLLKSTTSFRIRGFTSRSRMRKARGDGRWKELEPWRLQRSTSARDLKVGARSKSVPSAQRRLQRDSLGFSADAW